MENCDSCELRGVERRFSRECLRVLAVRSYRLRMRELEYSFI